MQIDNKDINEMENFDAVYAREMELSSSLEKVETAYVKTVERYGEYADLKSFAEYLCTIEKLFMENNFRKRSFEQSKEDMIKLRIKMLAKTGCLSEDVLNAIYEYFKKAGQTVDKIYEIAKSLLEKYKEDADCRDFIVYIKDTFIHFLNAEKEHLSMNELKERLIKARMEVLSSTGDPDLLTLETIYKEFRGLLGSK